jgi:hypothetical protein
MNTAIPGPLQARARKLGLLIIVDDDIAGGEHYGPFMLYCAKTGYPIWFWGLPAEGIADAMNCVEREHQLIQTVKTKRTWDDLYGWAETIVDDAELSAAIEAAWHDFGTGWAGSK